MLVSLVTVIRSRRTGFLPPTTGTATHAVFLKWLGRANQILAKEIHDMVNLKPYTVSGVQRISSGLMFIRTVGDMPLNTRELYWFRVYPKLSEILMTVFISKRPTEVEILEHYFSVEGITVSPEEHPWAGTSSEEELLGLTLRENIRPNKSGTKLSFLFHSPSTFKANGRSLPLPLPIQTFSSLVTRWNMYSQTPITQIFIHTWKRGLLLADTICKVN